MSAEKLYYRAAILKGFKLFVSSGLMFWIVLLGLSLTTILDGNYVSIIGEDYRQGRWLWSFTWRASRSSRGLRAFMEDMLERDCHTVDERDDNNDVRLQQSHKAAFKHPVHHVCNLHTFSFNIMIVTLLYLIPCQIES